MLEMRKTMSFGSIFYWWLDVRLCIYIEEVDEKSKCSTKIIVEHDGSPFNKVPLIVKLTEDGHASLTKDSLTIAKTVKTKEKVTDVQYKSFYIQNSDYIIIFSLAC